MISAQSLDSLIAQSEKIKVEKGEKSQEYLTMLDSIVQVANRADKLEICYKYREKHMEIVKTVYGENSVEYADDLIRLCNTDVRINQNYSSKVVEDYEKAVAIINKENRYVNVYAYTYALQFLGKIYYHVGNYEKSLEYYSQTLQIQKKVLGETHPDYAASLNNIGLLYSEMGNYEKTLEYYEQALKIRKQVLGVNHPDYASSLNNIGNVYYYMGNYGKALEYYEQALKIRKQVLGVNHPDYAGSLNNIGNVYADMGNYGKALEYYEQDLKITKQALDELHPDYASSLNNIGNVYADMGNYGKALEYHEQALRIRKQALGELHPDYASSLNNIGHVYQKMGNYEKALEYLELALQIRKQVLGVTHPDYAGSLNNIGNVYSDMGNYGKALEYYEQDLKITKQALGELHPDYAASLESIGNVYCEMGNYGKALEYLEQALKIRKHVLGETHPDYAASLNNIGLVYDYMGNYGKALEYYEQALKIRKQVLGVNHPDYASSLNNIGIVYKDMGNYGKALEHYERGLKIEKQAFGETHPYYAVYLNNIGNVYAVMGNYGKALEYYEQALKIQKQVLGVTHPDYAGSLENIGNVYDDMGNYGKALEYLEQALKIRKQVLGENHPDYASSLNNIGIVYKDMGNYGKALEYYEQALKIRKQVLGETHPYYAGSLENIGNVYAVMGNYGEVSNYWRRSFQIERKKLHENFRSLTEKERELYWDKNKEIYGAVVKLNYYLPNDAPTTQTSFNAELLKKGLLLTSEIEFQKIIQESGDSTLLADFEKMRIIRIMLNKQYEKPIAERTLNCDSLERVTEQLEKHLVRNCKEYGDYTRALALTWQDVRNALGTHDIAIEFTDVKLNNDSTIYAALILTKDMESPKYVPLFEQKEFEKRLQESKSKGFESDSTRGAMDSYRNQMGAYESTALYEMVWKPLEPYFPDSARIYFAPSGLFYQIAVEYAPISETRTMSDAYEIYRMSSTKLLAMDSTSRKYTSSVMYGGIEYDSDTTQMRSESSSYETRGDDEMYNSTATYNSFAAMNRDVQGHKGMKYLPGTKAEVEEIQRCLARKNISTTLYEGTMASEESFKALGGSDMTILHIATHGFYLDADTTKYKVDMSMSQTGLMFAGSNLAWTNKAIPEGVEDGILTAKEISHVDLRKTDLVVLSACQTGLGKVTGEGVFGLQRGFKNAGVKTIIMSLWSVDDFATKLMMTEFYMHLADGKSKREAFNLAQAKVRATYEDPYYWAGFIMLD